MAKEELKQFENEQLNTLLEELKDIDKFTGFSNGSFKYELGKYQANLLLEYINNIKQALIDIREYMKSIKDEPDADMYMKLGDYKEFQNILQIIDKVLGDVPTTIKLFDDYGEMCILPKEVLGGSDENK